MSFFKKLFGGASREAPSPADAPPIAETEHNGFRIQAVPYPEKGQFQLAGLISKEIDGETRQHRFIRAERFLTKEEAAEVALAKGRRIVDEQGDRLLG